MAALIVECSGPKRTLARDWASRMSWALRLRRRRAISDPPRARARSSRGSSLSGPRPAALCRGGVGVAGELGSRQLHRRQRPAVLGLTGGGDVLEVGVQLGP